jgi:hypothetical protein
VVEGLRDLGVRLLSFERQLAKLHAASVTRADLLALARGIVDDYFGTLRSPLQRGGFSDVELAPIDSCMHGLLESSHKRTGKTVYKRLIRDLHKAFVTAEGRVLASAGSRSAGAAGDATDRRIIVILQGLVPTAALAYEQALLDMGAGGRLSWRGPATDLREALRETLDHLAPDSEVTKQSGFKLEPNATGPTMKQKVRYVLRERGHQRAAVEASEAAVDSVESALGTFVRSVYTRSSVSTHTATGRDEVIRVRDFVRVALCELLEIRDV